ncbi:hypothetical protein [Dysgonomonas sp. 25]|uniref:hypothetical protein n=1 Tax=Dysgonomonas sp. 25 TaxID=2302933 RepID=UPI0013D8D866|nr:hypothetical protein [Dysgonomonas sp. 25]NDV67524.1 hypothetical protein [Dysgonomonas sp. 25]
MIEILAIVISILALFFSLLKDFILPLIKKPKLKFDYENKEPFRRFTLPQNHGKSCFLRIRLKNVGKRPAINCRCQILKIKKGKNNYGDYVGFPIRWACRPEKDVISADRERLNIGQGESEFLDIVTASSCNEEIYLCQYHKENIGISDKLEPGKYEIFIIISGDNFQPYILSFHIEKTAKINPDGLNGKKLTLMEGKSRNELLK